MAHRADTGIIFGVTGQMAKMLWKGTRIYLLIGCAMPMVAYLSGAGLEAVAWMLIMFAVILALLIVNLRKSGQSETVASEDVGGEMGLLQQQIENNTRAILGCIRDELSQIRSLISDAIEILQNGFIDVNHDIKTQNTIAQKLREDIRLVLESASQVGVAQSEINNLLDASEKEMSVITQRINKRIEGILRALQCEDIVRQLTESSGKHLNYLTSVLGAVNVGMHDFGGNKIDVSEYVARLRELRLQIEQLEAECRVEAVRSVSQCSMQQGDITLFNK